MSDDIMNNPRSKNLIIRNPHRMPHARRIPLPLYHVKYSGVLDEFHNFWLEDNSDQLHLIISLSTNCYNNIL